MPSGSASRHHSSAAKTRSIFIEQLPQTEANISPDKHNQRDQQKQHDPSDHALTKIILGVMFFVHTG